MTLLKQSGHALVIVVSAIIGYVSIMMGALSLLGHPVLAAAVVNVLIMIGVLLARRRRPAWFQYRPAASERLLPASFGWQVLGLTALAFLAGQALSSWLLNTVGSEGFREYQLQASATPALVLALFVLLLAPLGEEAMLRGLLLPLLRRRIGWFVSMVLTTGLFMLLHGNLIQAVVVLPLGFVQAVVYERSRRLLHPVLMHIGFNVAAVAVPSVLITSLASPLVGGALLAATLLLGVGLLRQGSGPVKALPELT